MQHEQLVDVLSRMTLDEKLGQLLQLTGDFYSDKAEERTGPRSRLGLSDDEVANAGTVLGVGGADECRRIQKDYMARHRLHIPTMFMGDIIHGYRTIFPIPLGLASSWSTDDARTMAEVSAKEAAVSGLFLTFSPMVDLVRDPRWGRVMESTGEDPYLNAQLARAIVYGYQGDDLRNEFDHIAACVKHFAAYGAPVGGRDYNTVNMSERELRDMYLPAYRAALDAGAKTVMTSFNTVDGIPSTGNKHLLRDILRGEWGFDGVVISDFAAIAELVAHGVAGDDADAAKLAIEAGVDIDMMSVAYQRQLKNLVASGKVQESLIDEAALRVLELKNDLGLFENPFRSADEETATRVVLCGDNRAAARKVAGESLVLLKNDGGVLPLDHHETIALLGPGAGSRDLMGAWSWQGKQDDVISIAQAFADEAAACDRNIISRQIASSHRIASSQQTVPIESSRTAGETILVGKRPCDYLHPSRESIDEAVTLAKQADVVVLVLGETSDMSGEAASRSDIRLPQEQIELFDEVRKANEHVVVVLLNGRPLDLTRIDGAQAIVEAWFPGTEAGHAIADVLYGKVNPSGKLTMSFPYSVGQVPLSYNEYSTGRPYRPGREEKYVSKYLDVSNDARYPFGFGLSYSSFAYGEVSVSASTFDERNPLRISVPVTNTSDVDGAEIVQLYVRDVVGEVVRPVKELKGFERIVIQAHRSATVEFTLTRDDVRYVHSDLGSRSDKGEFLIMVGPNSRDLSEPIRVSLV